MMFHINTQEKKTERLLRLFHSRLVASLLPVKPFANIDGNYTGSNRKQKRYNVFHILTPSRCRYRGSNV